MGMNSAPKPRPTMATRILRSVAMREVLTHRVQAQSVQDDDHQRPVLLGVPAPETAPRLVRPDAAQHGAGEAEEHCEADDAVDHVIQRLELVALAALRNDGGPDVHPAQHPSEE